MKDKRKKVSERSMVGVRVVHALILMVVFFGVIKAGKKAIAGLILLVTLLIFSEFLLILLAVKQKNEIPLLGIFLTRAKYLLPPGLFWLVFFSLGLEKLTPSFSERADAVYGGYLFALQLVWIVASLAYLKGGQYRKKIFYLSICVAVSLGLLQVTHSTLTNLQRGVFYFVFPCALVCVNDTAAYAVGKGIGSTPLTDISPKKTLEGFIGGGMVTVALSIPMARCTEWYAGESGLSYPHLLSLGGIASLIAPIGGFLASGYKRAFGVKHFGRLIPGHGGVVDRVDCQMVMQVAAQVYLSLVFKKRTTEHLLKELLLLRDRERVFLLKSLLESLRNQ
ncbi:phosphatidate cytidylyltransferase [Nematocida displodere]|uniref:phosphatidate cytidylyltransferase n=1 Tax=Nematocida displodere TaxID=1805483 RepID=A0A177ELH8_9MICR|nr:phosphatidate cytidylyltransferase [Nematocida displodere]